MITTKSSILKPAIAVLSAIALFFGVISSAYAAFLPSFSNTQSRVRVSQNSSHTLRFITPTGATGAGQTMVITFPTGYNFTAKTIGTVTFTHGATTGLENTETLAAVADATNWGAAFSGTNNVILTLTAPTDGTGAAPVAANDRIIITYNATNSVNPATPGSYQIGISGTFGDNGTTTVAIVLDDTVSVSAIVPQTISFAISATTTNFGTLTTGAARFASSTNVAGDSVETVAHTLAVATNAPAGYTITASGTTLRSQQNPSHTITEIGAVAASSTIGTEQFGIRATRAGGVNGTIAAPYASASSYGYNATSSAQTFASGTTATPTETYSLRYVANITALTEAGNYTTNITYVATANF
jgi:hypothetical protein